MKSNTLKTFFSHEIFKDERQLVIAIEAIHCQQYASDKGCSAWFYVKPIAVVVCSLEDTLVLYIQGQFSSIDQLRNDIPALDLAIKSFNGAII